MKDIFSGCIELRKRASRISSGFIKSEVYMHFREYPFSNSRLEVSMYVESSY